MRILTLDAAEYRVGWCVGDAGAKPKIGLLKLRDKKGGERTEEAVERFAKWLHALILEEKIELVVVEHFLPQGAMKGRTTDFTREGQIGLSYAARAVAAVCGVPLRSPFPSTIRKHFIGRATMGDRDSTKRAVIKMAQMLGYIPKDNSSDDEADAAALFDFASSHFASKASGFALT